VTSPLRRAVGEYFRSQNWRVEQVDDDGDVVMTMVVGRSGRLPVVVATTPAGTSLIVETVLPHEMPPGREVPLLELVARINDDLAHGCFTCRLADGTLRFRNSLRLPAPHKIADDVLVGLVAETVEIAVTETDKYVPLFADVLAGDVAPGLALELLQAGIDTTRS
jgi:hypothetical protein